jgi:hypothetical protein
MKTVIFACVHNAGRSQMAAAFFNQIADPAAFAGSPTETLNRFRQIRDQILERILSWLEERQPARFGNAGDHQIHE